MSGEERLVHAWSLPASATTAQPPRGPAVLDRPHAASESSILVDHDEPVVLCFSQEGILVTLLQIAELVPRLHRVHHVLRVLHERPVACCVVSILRSTTAGMELLHCGSYMIVFAPALQAVLLAVTRIAPRRHVQRVGARRRLATAAPSADSTGTERMHWLKGEVRCVFTLSGKASTEVLLVRCTMVSLGPQFIKFNAIRRLGLGGVWG